VYINADGCTNKDELVEMATEAKADVVFVLDTKYGKGDKHFGALHRDMRAIAGHGGRVYCRAMPYSTRANGVARIGGITAIVTKRIQRYHKFVDDPRG
jgi:hypothetical protein